MRRWGRSLFARGVIGAALVGVAALAAACDDGGPAARGFGSRQVRALRDSTFEFEGYAPNVANYSISIDPNHPVALNYFAVHFDTGEVEDLGKTLGKPAPPGKVYRCSEVYEENGRVLTITDSRTGASTVIDRVSFTSPSCPTDDDPSLVVWRWDDEKNVTLWVGPYDRLEERALPLVVQRIVLWSGNDGITTALGTLPEAPDARGLYTIDMKSLAIAELIPPVATAPAWAPGATPTGSLDSTSLGLSASPIGRYFVYERVMSDGGITFFVGPFPSEPTRELALFQGDPLGLNSRLSIQSLVPRTGYWPDPVWKIPHPVDGTPTLIYWRDASRRLITCPLSDRFISQGLVHPSGDRVFFYNQSDYSGGGVPGPLVMVSLDPDGGGSCTTLAEADVVAFFLSVNGNAIGWLSAPAEQDATLWVAAGDGSGARAIGAGDIAGPPAPPQFASDFELEFTLDGDIVWVDVRDEPLRLHYVGERVSGSVRDLGDYLIANVEHSTQDGTGRLVLIHRPTGTKRLISHDVSRFMTLTATGASAPGTWVAYLVSGRNPSPQDGVWIAKITEDDLR